MMSEAVAVINYADLLFLLGKSLQSDEYHHFVANSNQQATVIDNMGFAIYLDYEDLGLQVSYDTEQQAVYGITMWNSNLKYTQFKGNLPGGISFADNQCEVREKLGNPLSTGIRQGLNFPPEPMNYVDRSAAYEDWLAELNKQPKSDLEWAVYKLGPYEMEIVFDMSKNGILRSITMHAETRPAWAQPGSENEYST